MAKNDHQERKYEICSKHENLIILISAALLRGTSWKNITARKSGSRA